MAPVIVIPPGNRSVVAGSSEITLECVANARYAAGRPLGLQSPYNCREVYLEWKDAPHACSALVATVALCVQRGYEHSGPGRQGAEFPSLVPQYLR